MYSMKNKSTDVIYELSTDNFNAGIDFWLQKKPRWGRDFHNGLYNHLAEMSLNGFTDEWWEEMIKILWEWVAIRPKTKRFVHERGRARLVDLTKAYKHIVNKCAGKTPSNLLVEWKDIEPLFITAQSIKDVSSPVFASKLCHFILPSVFPVIDQEVLGGSKSYQDYWQFCKNLWLTTKDTDKLIKILTSKIGDNVAPSYPFTTKIVELCLIGRRYQFYK